MVFFWWCFVFFLLLLSGFVLFCWGFLFYLFFFCCCCCYCCLWGCLFGWKGIFFFLSQGLLVYFCYIAFELLVLFCFFNSTGLRFHLSLPPYQFSVDTFILSLRFCYHLLFLEQFPVSIPSSTHTEITSATTTTSSKCLGL